jgi:hypothetical protein
LKPGLGRREFVQAKRDQLQTLNQAMLELGRLERSLGMEADAAIALSPDLGSRSDESGLRA